MEKKKPPSQCLCTDLNSNLTSAPLKLENPAFLSNYQHTMVFQAPKIFQYSLNESRNSFNNFALKTFLCVENNALRMQYSDDRKEKYLICDN